MQNGVGGVVEDLADHLPADSCVRPAFDLDEGGQAILIEEKMIEGQPTNAAGVAGDRLLLIDQHEAPGVGAIDLVSGQ
jgi:hypothetical protein